MLWTKSPCSVQSRWGCRMSVEEDRAQRERNIEIERQIKADRAALRNRVKILLLGQLEYLVGPLLGKHGADKTKALEDVASRRF